METRLVVLNLDHPYAKDAVNPALVEAESILNNRGSSPRLYRNTLVFLAADRARLDELMPAVRYFLAWQSIEDDREKLNLDNYQSRQAATQKDNWNRTVDARITETFQWLLVPTQPTPQSPVEWQAIRLTGQDSLAARACRRLRSDSQMVLQYASSLLKGDLEKIPLWRGNHVAVCQILDDYARYLYLQRVRGPEVILAAIRDGVSLMMWATDSFAYAESWDEAKQRYIGLHTGKMIDIAPDSTGLLVKPDIAEKQITAEKPTALTSESPSSSAGPDTTQSPPAAGGGRPSDPAFAKLKRFHATVRLDPSRIGRDAGRIAEEVVQHLALLPDANVEIVLEIQAELPDGTPENIVRTVTENCRTLKFKSQGFEQD